MQSRTPARIRFSRAIVLLTVLFGGLLLTAFTDAESRTHTTRQAPILLSEMSLVQSLTSDTGFDLADGHWQVPALQWTFQQTQLKFTEDLSGKELPDSVSVPPCELDHHLLGLIHSLMTVDTVDGNTRWYALHSSDLVGCATTVQCGENEIPVSLRFRWPAYDDFWTEVVAQRMTDPHDVQSLLQLPAGCDIVATRVAAGGSAQCHLISSGWNSSTLHERMEADGWNVETPPAAAGLTGLFWISSAAGRFEVSAKDAVGGSGCSAIVRRI